MRAKRLLINALGFFCLGIGAAGVFLPLLPTTPFVLLATMCFSRNNRKFYKRLKRTPFFSSYIVHYEEKQGVPMSLKIKSILFVWVSLSLSMLALQTIFAYILLSVIGAGVTAHLLMIKTKEKSESHEKQSGHLLRMKCPLCVVPITPDQTPGLPHIHSACSTVPDKVPQPRQNAGSEQSPAHAGSG